MMESAARTSKVLHFSDYVLNLQTAELCRNGDKTTLQDQPFQILIALLQSLGSWSRGKN